MEHKKPIKIKFRTFLPWMFVIFGVLVFGMGMCLCLVWQNIIAGTAVGLLGILLLLLLIPIVKGFK